MMSMTRAQYTVSLTDYVLVKMAGRQGIEMVLDAEHAYIMPNSAVER